MVSVFPDRQVFCTFNTDSVNLTAMHLNVGSAVNLFHRLHRHWYSWEEPYSLYEITFSHVHETFGLLAEKAIYFVKLLLKRLVHKLAIF